MNDYWFRSYWGGRHYRRRRFGLFELIFVLCAWVFVLLFIGMYYFTKYFLLYFVWWPLRFIFYDAPRWLFGKFRQLLNRRHNQNIPEPSETSIIKKEIEW